MTKLVTLNDIFIGNYPLSQRFGVRKWYYWPKFRWRGHNGLDFSMKPGAQLIACVSGTVIISRNDPKGWGEYCYVWDKTQNALVIYAHMSKRQVSEGQYIQIGQRIGLSGNTGNSTGAHLHFGVYRCNDFGIKINTLNGYGGAIDPLDARLVRWKITNPSKPL